MMNESVRKKIEFATVTFNKLGGRGVLVEGGYIITAAHCIEFDIEGGPMALGVYYTERITTSYGDLLVSPVLVEPVSDIAVLGPVDGQELPGEAEKFEEFYQAIEPVIISRRNLLLFKSIPVFIFTHHKTWVEGTVTMYKNNAPTLVLKTTKAIEPGTSGSPVVDELGKLIGVASIASMDQLQEGGSGSIPHLKLALPLWILFEMGLCS